MREGGSGIGGRGTRSWHPVVDMAGGTEGREREGRKGGNEVDRRGSRMGGGEGRGGGNDMNKKQP